MAGAVAVVNMQQDQPNTFSKAADTPAGTIMQATQAGAGGGAAAQWATEPHSTHSSDSKPAGAATKALSSSSPIGGGACVKLAAGSKTVTAGAGLSAAAAAASAAFVAAKLGLADQLEAALVKNPGMACLKDTEGRALLHFAAGYGHEVREWLVCLAGGCSRPQQCPAPASPLHDGGLWFRRKWSRSWCPHPVSPVIGLRT